MILQVNSLRNTEVFVGFANFVSYIEVHVLTDNFLDVVLNTALPHILVEEIGRAHV